MKNYVTIFTRPNTSVMFPELAHFERSDTQVGSLSEISEDLLTLTFIRTFATEADAIAYSQNPEVVAFHEAQAAKMEGTGITRQITL